MSKIFGIGWAKTGTTTLGRCFRILGYDHQSQDLSLVRDLGRGELSRILEIAAQKDTFEDWPWLILFRELDLAFPGSQFVLTIRNSKNWVHSYENMLANQGKASTDLNEIRHILYDLPFPDVTAEALVARYERHNAEVMAYFSARPGTLLVVDWAKGDGWRELCDFLKRPVPSVPFPHMNQGAYGLRSFAERGLRSIRKAWS